MTDKSPDKEQPASTFAVFAECAIDSEALAYFDTVVRELACLLNPDAIRSLRAVIVVERTKIPSKLNELIRTADAYRSYVPGDAQAPEGVALPLERDGNLDSFVVIARETAESLSRPVHFRSPNAISTILEELLHVCVYGLAKSRRGYVHPDQTSTLPCDVDLHVIASQMCDEYVVNRLKARIVGRLPLVQAQPGSPLTVGELRYGAVPLALVSQGLERLSLVLGEGRSGARPASEAWAIVTRILADSAFSEPATRALARPHSVRP